MKRFTLIFTAIVLPLILFLQSPILLGSQVEAQQCLKENAVCVGSASNVKCCGNLICHNLKCTNPDNLINDKKGDPFTCTCDDPGKSNKYTCKRGSEEIKTECKDDGKVCNADGGFTQEPKDGPLKAKTIKGIKCGDGKEEKDEKLPPPPSPPCKEFGSKGECKSVQTSLGDLSTDPKGFISSLFAILLSLSGGIALLLIIKAGYQIIASRGNPEKLQQARDQLIAAIVGLLFLIFSFVLLQTISVDVLRLPGWK